MPGLLRGVARTAVIAGTATAVSNRVSRRQGQRWAQQEAPADSRPRAAPRPRRRRRVDDRSAQGAGRAEKPGHPHRGGVRGAEGQAARVGGPALRAASDARLLGSCSSTVSSAVGLTSRRPSGIGSPLLTERP